MRAGALTTLLRRAIGVANAGETTPNLGLPVGPFVWAATAGCRLFTLALLIRLGDAFRRLARP